MLKSGRNGLHILDESGDLGFDFTKKKTTKYFIVTFLDDAYYKIIKGLIVEENALFP